MVRRLIGVALLAVALGGCTKVGSSGGDPAARRNAFTRPHVLRFADTNDTTSLNPHLVQGGTLNLMSQLTMAWLARYDQHNRPIPELLTVIPTQANGGISKDGKTITWHLRKDARWSDGVPFTADDMVFSTRVVQNPKNNEAAHDGWDRVLKIDEPDKYTVVYHLSTPYASYLPTFFGTAGANPCLLPKHLLDKYPTINDVPYNALPIGIGPFKYESWKRGESVTAVANDTYFRGRPKLEKVVWKIVPDRNTLVAQLQTGDADMWPPPGAAGFYDRIKALPGFKLDLKPSAYWAHMDFNLTRPIVRDVRVRRALRYALDRKLLLQKVNHGVGILLESPYPIPNPAHIDVPFVNRDVGKARALLDAAGWHPGRDGIRVKDGTKLVLEFATGSGSPDTDTRLEIIRQSWREVGADLNIKHYPPAMLFANYHNNGIIYNGKFDVVTFLWGGNAVGDYYNLYSCGAFPPRGQNVPHYCSAKVDAAMASFKLLYDEKARLPYAATVQREMVKDVPVIVLYDGMDISLYNADLKNYAPNTITPFDDMMKVDI